MIDISYFKGIHGGGEENNIIQGIFEKVPLTIEMKGYSNSSHAVNPIMAT